MGLKQYMGKASLAQIVAQYETSATPCAAVGRCHRCPRISVAVRVLNAEAGQNVALQELHRLGVALVFMVKAQ